VVVPLQGRHVYSRRKKPTGAGRLALLNGISTDGRRSWLFLRSCDYIEYAIELVSIYARTHSSAIEFSSKFKNIFCKRRKISYYYLYVRVSVRAIEPAFAVLNAAIAT